MSGNLKEYTLDELECELADIARNVSVEDMDIIMKGSTPPGWSDASPKIMSIRRIWQEIQARTKHKESRVCAK